MIRLNPTARPESWTTIEINLDGEPQTLRARFWLLKPTEAAEWTAERLRGYHEIRKDSDAGLDYLLRELSPAQLQRVHDTLMERLVDWDLQDADGGKLDLTPEHKRAVLEHGAFLRPLFQGLLDASSGAARKNS